ncbi:MAG: porin family protein [Flavobacteriales bacterium]
MKKIAIIVGLLLCTQFLMSQSKYRFGLKIAPSFNWLSPDNVKKFENAGTTVGFNWGLTGEYLVSDNFSIYSGLELNHERGKIGFLNSTFYAMKEDFELVETKEVGGFNVPEDTSAFVLALTERAYRSNYVTIPIGVKMKTKEIGYMTYFGEFGLNLAFRTGTKINDKATLVDPRANASESADYNDLEDVNYDTDMQPLRMQLRVGIGAEYKIAEGTSVFGAVHYNLGFTNVVKGDSRYLVDDDDKVVTQKFTAHGVQITVGVLF